MGYSVGGPGVGAAVGNGVGRYVGTRFAILRTKPVEVPLLSDENVIVTPVVLLSVISLHDDPLHRDVYVVAPVTHT